MNKIKIINIDAKTSKGILKLQGALDVKYCYSLVKNYFETELLSKPEELSDFKLQKVLNKKVKDVSSFYEYTFDNDFRIIELAVLIGILESLNRAGGFSSDYSFIPAWQLPNQNYEMKEHSHKESWDGFIFGCPKDPKSDAISIPLELKSLMTNPKKIVTDNPNEQLKKGLASFKKHFQHEGSINCVLVMPYTDQLKLSIDLKHATDDLRSTVSSKATSIVSLLTFPYDQNGGLMMSILFALVASDKKFMSHLNIKNSLFQINFGKAN